MQSKVDDEIIGATPPAFNITEQNCMIAALKKSEERFRKAFATNPDAMTINRLGDGMFVSINEGFTKITGYTEEETKAKTSFELNIWTSSSQRDSIIKGLKAGGTFQNMEGKFRKKDGSLRDGMISATIIDLEGVPHILSITRDITERKIAEQELEERTKELQKELEERNLAEKELKKSHKQLEVSKLATLNLLDEIRDEMNQRQHAEELSRRRSEELRISEEKFKNVFEYASVGKSLTMIDGTVHPNKAFCQLLGYTKKEMKNINWRALTYPEDILKNEEIINSILRGDNKSVRWEKRFLNKSGEIIWVDISTTLQRDLNDKPLFFITTVVDITKKKRSEEKIIQLNAELEQRVIERTSQLEAANKELQAFAYSVSHDLRTPLRAIDGFSKFLLEDYESKLDSEGKKLLGLIRSSTLKMDKLITDILSLSKVTRADHKVSKVDMRMMAISMLNEVASPEVQEKISLKIDALPESYADPAFIKQVWINLISNALKFSSLRKGQEIKIGGYTQEGFNVYYISDNGVGFNPEYAHKLFGVFQRLHKEDEFEGTGVGLAIVQRIIHRHGGKVWAEGREGEGATFYFSLPVKIK